MALWRRCSPLDSLRFLPWCRGEDWGGGCEISSRAWFLPRFCASWMGNSAGNDRVFSRFTAGAGHGLLSPRERAGPDCFRPLDDGGGVLEYYLGTKSRNHLTNGFFGITLGVCVCDGTPVFFARTWVAKARVITSTTRVHGQPWWQHHQANPHGIPSTSRLGALGAMSLGGGEHIITIQS